MRMATKIGLTSRIYHRHYKLWHLSTIIRADQQTNNHFVRNVLNIIIKQEAPSNELLKNISSELLTKIGLLVDVVYFFALPAPQAQ